MLSISAHIKKENLAHWFFLFLVHLAIDFIMFLSFSFKNLLYFILFRCFSNDDKQWKQVYIVQFKWSISFECPHPVIFSLFRILTICFICKSNGNISKKTTMAFTFKMLKLMFLTYMLHSMHFSYHCFCFGIHQWFPVHVIYHNIYVWRYSRQLSSQLILWFILKLWSVVVLVNVSVSSILKQTLELDLQYLSEPTTASNG